MDSYTNTAQVIGTPVDAYDPYDQEDISSEFEDIVFVNREDITDPEDPAYLPDTVEDEDDSEVFLPVDVGNYVWMDTNEDGLQNGDEPGIENVTVWLIDATTGNTLETTTTDTTGHYLFEDVYPGDYIIQFIPDPTLLIEPTIPNNFTTDKSGDQDDPDSDALTITTGANPEYQTDIFTVNNVDDFSLDA